MLLTTKSLLLGGAFIIGAVGALVTNGEENFSTKQGINYYAYSLNIKDLDAYQNQNNWTKISSPAQATCEGGTVPCVVTSDQANLEDFVESIQTEADVESHTISRKQEILP